MGKKGKNIKKKQRNRKERKKEKKDRKKERKRKEYRIPRRAALWAFCILVGKNSTEF